MRSILRISLLTSCVPGGDTTDTQPALELMLGPEYLRALCQQTLQSCCLEGREWSSATSAVVLLSEILGGCTAT